MVTRSRLGRADANKLIKATSLLLWFQAYKVIMYMWDKGCYVIVSKKVYPINTDSPLKSLFLLENMLTYRWSSSDLVINCRHFDKYVARPRQCVGEVFVILVARFDIAPLYHFKIYLNLICSLFSALGWKIIAKLWLGLYKQASDTVFMVMEVNGALAF